MSDKKPNLIYIFADQLRYSSLGCNGDELACTPNIDAFSEECTVMDNAVSGHPVCAPYRASLLTGKYTTSTGMVINEIRLNPSHKTFAHVLNEAGYETAYIGKWHMYAAQLGHHFDVKNSYIPKGADRLGFDGYFAGYNFHHKYYSPFAYYHLDSDEKIFAGEGVYEPDMQTDMAIEQLRRLRNNDKPFALFLSLGTPHDPWTGENVPERYLDMFKNTEFPLPPNYKKLNDPHADMWARFMPGERGKLNSWKQVYYAMTANLDYNIGRLLDEIKESGLDKNSIVIFTSDHGEMFGAQGRRAKNIFYDEAVRVPFMIKWGESLSKRRCSTSFNTVDIMPTLLNMMELPVPSEVQGENVSDCILNGTDREKYSLLMGTGPTAVYGDGFEWRGIRSDRYTYAVYKVDGKEFLFDNINDPYQTNNLAADLKYSELLNFLKIKMYAMMEEAGDDFEKNSFYKKYWIKDRVIQENLPRRSEI